MDQAINDMITFNLQHREVAGVSAEHTFWMFYEYWWVFAIIIGLSIVIVKCTKEN